MSYPPADHAAELRFAGIGGVRPFSGVRGDAHKQRVGLVAPAATPGHVRVSCGPAPSGCGLALMSDLSLFTQNSDRPSPLVSAMTGRNRSGRPSRRSGPAAAATAGAVSASQVPNRSAASR